MIPTSAYVHFPWCLQKCPYCDFATRATDRSAIPHEEYADAVIRELSLHRDELADRVLVSIFFGGGTPSLWDPRALGRVLDAIRSGFSTLSPFLEVSVECNPSSLDLPRARALIERGVNRLSVGVQALDDASLRFLGRLHDTDGALAAVDAALTAAPRASADLIFGLPGRRPDDAARDAEALVAHGLRHVSAYALTIEPATQFGALAKKGKLPLAPEDDVADGALAVTRTLAARGLAHYEVSNHATPGEESIHNLHYWRGGDYLGLGAGAVGLLSTQRWRNDPDGLAYIAGAGIVERETLSPEDRIHEALMLGLRTSEGIDLGTIAARVGVDPAPSREQRVERLVGRGDLVRDGDRLKVPEGKWFVLDSIVRQLF